MCVVELNDRCNRMRLFEAYPSQLRALESQAIEYRRRVVDGTIACGEPSISAPTVPESASASALPADTVGLALSGGGIRSATFCLGVLQSLARRGLLRHIDFLSTVSGGGYIGGFVGRFYDRLRDYPGQAADIVEGSVGNSASQAIRWLRKHGKFIAPAGKSDEQLGLAIYLRSLLTLHFVLGSFLLALYGCANIINHGLLTPAGTLYFSLFGSGSATWPYAFLTIWFFLAFVLTLWRLIPLSLAYWLASQDEEEAFSPPGLLFVWLFQALFLYVIFQGHWLVGVAGFVAVLLPFLDVHIAWKRVRSVAAAAGSGGARVAQLRARSLLSRELGLWLAITLTLVYLALIDTLGRVLYEATKPGAERKWIFALWGLVVAAFPLLRAIATGAIDRQSKAGPPNPVISLLNSLVFPELVASLLLGVPILFVSFVSHASFDGGRDLPLGIFVALAAFVVSLIFAYPLATTLINRTSLQATYAARLARAYLGASNPNRASNEVDDVMPGDDVDTLTDYQPHLAGGPVHLVNVCINQTLDKDTLRSGTPRLGVPMACSGLGLSIGRYWHAIWNPRYQLKPHRSALRAPRPSEPPLRVVGNLPGTPHPLLGADGQPPDWLELLPLRDWIAISGAAFGPGQGLMTSPAWAALFLLTNLRIGYWWNSGLTADQRGALPQQFSIAGRLLWLFWHAFETQTRLIAEATARFRGPWDNLWYLSDGGHFENLGGYELIRREIPYIIMVDGTGGFTDFPAFSRIVRIDFQAELHPISQEEWDNTVDRVVQNAPPEKQADVREEWTRRGQRISLTDGDGGPLEGATVPDTGVPPAVKKHAALLKIKHRSGRESFVLYLRASISGDEPLDVLQYHAANPDFPSQSTVNQFFDEPQWECYRQLGEHIGGDALPPIPAEPTSTKRSYLWLTEFESSQKAKAPSAVAG